MSEYGSIPALFTVVSENFLSYKTASHLKASNFSVRECAAVEKCVSLLRPARAVWLKKTRLQAVFSPSGANNILTHADIVRMETAVAVSSVVCRVIFRISPRAEHYIGIIVCAVLVKNRSNAQRLYAEMPGGICFLGSRLK